MEHTEKIELPSWAKSSGAQTLFKAIPESVKNLRFVGGCVRNTLLNQEITDIDLATPYSPFEILDFLKAANLKGLETGLDHGTVTAVIEGQPFEITTLRKDVKTYGRHADVSFTKAWEEDAMRRDFTMNALYLDISGTLYDYCNGRVDLENRQVRFIGKASERVQEDFLRILRYFRFFAHYGTGTPDEQGIEACETHASSLKDISRERVHQEVFKTLAAKDPLKSFELMNKTGVFSVVFGTQLGPDLERLVTLELETGAPLNPLRRLYILFEVLPKDLDERLVLSNRQKKYLRNLGAILKETGRKASYLLYFYGPGLYQDKILLESEASPPIKKALEKSETWSPPTFPVTGDDLLEHGFSPGPELGTTLKNLEKWWVGEDFKPDRKACLEILKRSL